MILYVNGGDHAAAAEAANQYLYSSDDAKINYLSGVPHPENLAVSWGKLLSLSMRATLYCDARRGATNERIMSETRDWLSDNKNSGNLIIIQWVDFEDQVSEHEQIWNLHQDLVDDGISHIFFNGDQPFDAVSTQYDWGINYLSPYDAAGTYSNIIKENNIDTVSSDSKNFGIEGHSYFNRFMLQYIIDNKLI